MDSWIWAFLLFSWACTAFLVAGLPYVTYFTVRSFVYDKRRRDFWRRRKGHPTLWRRAFSGNELDKVERMLSVICDSFLISPKYRYRLRPSDDIHWFYAMNTKGSCVDSLEYESLCHWVEYDFQLDAENIVSQQSCTVSYLVRQVATPLKRMPSEPAEGSGVLLTTR